MESKKLNESVTFLYYLYCISFFVTKISLFQGLAS